MASDKPVVFLDTNILIDYMIDRDADFRSVEMIFEAAFEERISLTIAAHSLTNLFYIIRNGYSVAYRKQSILNFCSFCNVQPVSGESIEKAITADFTPDLEDSLQIQCAIESKSDFMVTRDKALFDIGPIKTLPPHELIRELSL